jgi:DNA-binding FrmR family transcriptional regulator
MRPQRTLPAPVKIDVQKRLKSIRGQVDGVMRMVDEDRYCVDVMRQISAIIAALERVAKIELKNHFEHCYADAIRNGDDARAQAEIAELLGLTELSR